MAYQQREPRPNSGILFKNDRKTSDRHPDYTGKWTDENGNELNLAAWIKEGAKGKFMTLSASEPQSQKRSESRGEESQDDEAPF